MAYLFSRDSTHGGWEVSTTSSHNPQREEISHSLSLTASLSQPLSLSKSLPLVTLIGSTKKNIFPRCPRCPRCPSYPYIHPSLCTHPDQSIYQTTRQCIKQSQNHPGLRQRGGRPVGHRRTSNTRVRSQGKTYFFNIHVFLMATSWSSTDIQYTCALTR